MDNKWGWMLRWVTPALVVVSTVAMIVLKDRFFTREEAKELVPIPGKVQQLEVDFLPMKPIPARVTRLEEIAANQQSLNSKRDIQIEQITNAINQLSVQQGIALSKLDDIKRNAERTENKVDQITRKQ